MKTKYHAGDLSKIIASVSPKAVQLSADSTIEKHVTRKKGRTDKLLLQEMTVQNKSNKEKLINKKNGKQEHVVKSVEKQTSANEKKKKKKKDRQSFGCHRRLEKKKKKETLEALGRKNEDNKAENRSKVGTPKLRQKNKTDLLFLNEGKYEKNDGSATVPDPNIKKEKLLSKSENSDIISDSNDDDDCGDRNLNKSENSSSDDSSDEDEKDDDIEKYGGSEDDLSFKNVTDFSDEESENASDSDVEGEDENMLNMDVEQAEGFCPPEGIVHESLKKKGEKRKHDIDSTKENAGQLKKQKLDDSGKEKGTRPRKDRLAKATNDRTVFVGNLSVKTSKKQLAKMFSKFGEVESTRFRTVPVNDPKLPKKVIAIKKNFHPQRNIFNGYVCFTNAESAKKALVMNGTEVDGLHVRVDMVGSKTKGEPKKSVFVGNLPLNIEEETVREHFDDCGEVENVRIVRDKGTCLGKGFGFVTFKDSDGVFFALKLNESKLKGRKLRIESCVEGKKQNKQKVDKAGKNNQQKDKSILQTEGSAKAKIPKEKKKKKKQTTPSNVVKNPFQGEKEEHEKMKLKITPQNALKTSKKDSFLKNDIEKILKEGQTEIKKAKDSNLGKTRKKLGDDKVITKSLEINSAQFGKESKSGSKKFDKKFNTQGKNFTKNPVEKGRHFGKKPGLNEKKFASTPKIAVSGVNSSAKKATHIKFD